MTPSAKPSLILLLCLTLAACAPTSDERTPAGSNGAENWKRDQRTFVYLSERRARYAGITRTAEGRLLILYTHQTAQQERDGSGELQLVRRTRDGDWWFYPETVFEGRQGEPRAMGTLATLASGRIIAPFAELDDSSAGSRLRLLSSEDHGETWTASAPLGTKPLIWATPYGRPFEAGDRLLMPVHGAVSREDLDGHPTAVRTAAVHRWRQELGGLDPDRGSGPAGGPQLRVSGGASPAGRDLAGGPHPKGN